MDAQLTYSCSSRSLCAEGLRMLMVLGYCPWVNATWHTDLPSLGGSESPRAHPPWMQMFWFNVVLLFTAPAVTQCYLWAAEVGELPWRLWYPAMLFSLGLGMLNGKRFEITELDVFFVCTLRRSMIFSVMAKEPKGFSAFPAGLAFTVFIYSQFIHSAHRS